MSDLSLCPKCGGMGTSIMYDEERDMLRESCMRCSFTRLKPTLDAKDRKRPSLLDRFRKRGGR